ncbi:hypothetical protein M1N79_04805, partial [Dehalococcoidia bacterium]|nr:hypothetical protein [Dehalococcoidia bacterium]
MNKRIMSLLLAAGLVLTTLLVSACPSLPQPEEPFPHVIALVPEWSGFIETDQWNFGATLVTASPEVMEARFIGAQLGDQFISTSGKDEWT